MEFVFFQFTENFNACDWLSVGPVEWRKESDVILTFCGINNVRSFI